MDNVYICPICYKQNQCTEGTVTYLGLVVQSRVRFNPGLKFNPLFYSSFSISVSFKITETKITIDAGKICKKYLEAYKQIAVKFLLNWNYRAHIVYVYMYVYIGIIGHTYCVKYIY